MNNLLDQLAQIIHDYDSLCDCWLQDIDPNDFVEKMDSLRNEALEIIAKLKKERSDKDE